MKNHILLSFTAIVVALSTPSFGQPTTNNTSSVVNGVACVNQVEMVPQAGIRDHIPEGQEPVYSSNPPVTGEHYARWGRYQVHADTLPRGFWVHNLEHGAIVFAYQPDADPALIEALLRVYDAIPNDPACGHRRTLVTPDPLLDAPWAVTSSGLEPNPAGGDFGFGYFIKGDCIESEQALVDFAVEHRNQAFEDVCGDGDAP
jgi:hypothetical protein